MPLSGIVFRRAESSHSVSAAADRIAGNYKNTIFISIDGPDRRSTRPDPSYGAPDAKAALPAAEAEFAAGLCEYKPHTLLSVERDFGADGIVERFKVVRPRTEDAGRPRVWSIVEGGEDD